MEVWQRYGPGKPYYARFQVRGKRYLWSTKTTDERAAKARAKDYRARIIAKEFGLADLMKTANKMPSFTELFDEYLTLPLRLPRETRKQNIANFKVVLDALGIAEKDGIFKLGEEAALSWQSHCLKSQGKAISGASKEVSRSEVVTCNSRLRKARSLFSKRALRLYTIKLPKERIAAFMSVPLLPEGESIRPLPSEEAMTAAEAELPKHPAEWCAYLLVKFGGMRPKEVIAARWDWLDGDVIHVGGRFGDARTKTKRFRPVRLSPEIVAEMQRARPDNEFICGPRALFTVRRSLPQMLRTLGFIDMPDPLYSLRRWHGSWRYEFQSPSAARDALGHTTETTTMKHYARRLSLPEAIPFTPAPTAAVS